VAHLAGVSADTLHHYERVGVLPPVERDENGYRRYPADTVKRVASIRRALDLGFTLEELSRFFRARDSGSPPCRRVRALAEQKLEQTREQIAALQLLERELTTVLSEWDARLEQGEPARLLLGLGG